MIRDNNIRFFCIVLLTLIFSFGNAQFEKLSEPVFKHFSTSNGLPTDEVYRSLQDEEGIMWFATDKGVSKFDGYDFTTFTTKDGLTDNTVLYFHEDHNKRIWFITLNNQLCYHENDKIIKYQFNDTIKKHLPSSIISDFNTDYIGHIYIGTNNEGILRIDSNGLPSFLHGTTKSNKKIYQFEDKYIYGVRYPTEYNGVRVNGVELFTDSSYLDILLKDPPMTRKGIMSRFCKYSEGVCITYGESMLFIPSDGSFWQIPAKERVIFIKEINNIFWVGLYKGGIVGYEIRNKSLHLKHHFLKSESVSSVYTDRDGGFWFTSLEKGTYYSSNFNFKKLTFQKSIEDHCVTSLEKTSAHIFLGLRNGNIIQIPFDTGSPKLIYDKLGMEVTDMVYDSIDQMLYADVGAITAFDSTGVPSYELGGKTNISDFDIGYITGKGKRFFGNHLGLFQFSDDTIINHFSRLKTSKRVCSISEYYNQLFVSTSDKVFVFDSTCTNFSISTLPIKGKVISMSPYLNGFVLATSSNGIYFWNNDSLQHYTVGQGLNSNNTTSLLVNKNELWVGTSNGINKGKLKNGIITFVGFSTINGMVENEINDLLIVNNWLLCAGNKGLSIINTNNLNPTSKNDIVLSLKSARYNHNHNLSNSQYVSYDENNIEFEFHGLYYPKLSNIEYRYRLNGLSQEWIYTSERKATFQNLPPGKYSFELSAKNDDKTWSKETSLISFSISPPFWQTTLFKIFIFISCIILIYLIFRIKILSFNREVLNDLIKELIKRIKRKEEKEEAYIMVKSVKDGILTKINISSIQWIEASGNYSEIVCLNQRVIVRSIIKEMEQQLAEVDSCIRVHKSYIVNIDNAIGMNSKEIKVIDTSIPIGRTYLSTIKIYKEKITQQAIN